MFFGKGVIFSGKVKADEMHSTLNLSRAMAINYRPSRERDSLAEQSTI